MNPTLEQVAMARELVVSSFDPVASATINWSSDSSDSDSGDEAETPKTVTPGVMSCAASIRGSVGIAYEAVLCESLKLHDAMKKHMDAFVAPMDALNDAREDMFRKLFLERERLPPDVAAAYQTALNSLWISLPCDAIYESLRGKFESSVYATALSLKRAYSEAPIKARQPEAQPYLMRRTEQMPTKCGICLEDNVASWAKTACACKDPTIGWDCAARRASETHFTSKDGKSSCDTCRQTFYHWTGGMRRVRLFDVEAADVTPLKRKLAIDAAVKQPTKKKQLVSRK